MVKVSFPVKWEQFLNRLADDHGVDLDAVVSKLSEWAFFNAKTE